MEVVVDQPVTERDTRFGNGVQNPFPQVLRPTVVYLYLAVLPERREAPALKIVMRENKWAIRPDVDRCPLRITGHVHLGHAVRDVVGVLAGLDGGESGWLIECHC